MRKNKLMNKRERSLAIKSVKGIPLHTLVQVLEKQLKEQLDDISEQLKDILQALLEDEGLLKALIEYHHAMFATLYDHCSTGKEKYARFQLEWHAHVSVFLIPKHIPIESVLTTDQKTMAKDADVCTVRRRWQTFCDAHSSYQDHLKKIMILFSSSLYNAFLKEIHSSTSEICSTTGTGTASTVPIEEDSDDVYFRFGGAALSDMLHLHYKNIRIQQLQDNKRDVLSQEISCLQAINTKEKGDMPKYLQYRDRGYMYTPHVSFIPFFREVDNCIKEVINPTGFKEHGDELVKVNMCSTCIFIYCLVYCRLHIHL